VDQLHAGMEDIKGHVRTYGNHLGSVDARLRDMGDRQLELLDADLLMEERVENLEALGVRAATQGRPRRKSTSDSLLAGESLFVRRRPWSSSGPSAAGSLAFLGPEQAIPSVPLLSSALAIRDPPPSASPTLSWTVHISLLPDASRPFPFERDTNAYKRCLSRGLHQMVVVSGTDDSAFRTAVSRAFGGLLRGRPWMPLQAKLCDAEPLQGLPMLRQLDPKLRDGQYDTEFLRQHCAVCDATGKIESLYIAMRTDTLSWHFLGRSPVFMEGLESCWAHDQYLDPVEEPQDDSRDHGNRPSAGDMVTGLPLKRGASEISRGPNFDTSGASTDGGDSRKKLQRMSGLVELHRRAERV
jgi:hypothetical protein